MPKRKLQPKHDDGSPESKTQPKKYKVEQDDRKVRRKSNVRNTSNVKLQSASKSKEKVVESVIVSPVQAFDAHDRVNSRSSKTATDDNEDLPVSLEALEEVHNICKEVLRKILLTAVQYQKHAHREKLTSSDFDFALTQLGIEL